MKRWINGHLRTSKVVHYRRDLTRRLKCRRRSTSAKQTILTKKTSYGLITTIKPIASTTRQRAFFATDGFCTHEEQHLEDGIVIDNVIECPLHQGRFDIRSGKALSAPVCIDLKTYPIEVRDGAIYLFLDNETPQS